MTNIIGNCHQRLSKIPGLSAIAKKLAEKGDADLKKEGEKVEAGLVANKTLNEEADGDDKRGG